MSASLTHVASFYPVPTALEKVSLSSAPKSQREEVTDLKELTVGRSTVRSRSWWEGRPRISEDPMETLSGSVK